MHSDVSLDSSSHLFTLLHSRLSCSSTPNSAKAESSSIVDEPGEC